MISSINETNIIFFKLWQQSLHLAYFSWSSLRLQDALLFLLGQYDSLVRLYSRDYRAESKNETLYVKIIRRTGNKTS